MAQQAEQADAKNYLVRLIAVVLTGILAGIAGMLLALLLHAYTLFSIWPLATALTNWWGARRFLKA